MNVAGMMTGANKTSSMLDAIENGAAQVESSGADITSSANGIAASDAELTAAKTVREKEATDYSKSEAELVEVADTLKRAICELSERMRVISLPSHRRDNFCSERPPVTPRGLRVFWCEGSVNGLCCTVCSSHSVVHFLFLA